MATTIKVVVVETTASEGVRQRVVEFRDGARVLHRETYQSADTEAAWLELRAALAAKARDLAAKAGPLVGDVLEIDAETGEEVSIEPGIPAERAAQYAAIFAEYAKTGATEAPADYDAAVATVDAWIDAGADDAEKLARTKVAMRLLTMRVAMLESGCTWPEALAWYAAQPQPEE
jgi:hypothetical protein